MGQTRNFGRQSYGRSHLVKWAWEGLFFRSISSSQWRLASRTAYHCLWTPYRRWAVRTAVALRLGTTLCVSHPCPCGAQVDAYGVHSLVCKRASGKITRHQPINGVIARAFVAANLPVTKEPSGLLIADNKRPDGLTFLPWQEGKPLAWDVTVIYPCLNWPPRRNVRNMQICLTLTSSSL